MHTAIVFVLLVVLIVQIDRAVIAQKPTIDTKTKTKTNAKTKMTTSITTNTPTPTMTPEATTPATAPTSATAITTTIPQWAIDIRDNPIFGMFPRMHNRSIINIWNYKTNTKEYFITPLAEIKVPGISACKASNVLTDVFLLKMPIVFIDKSVREKVATWIAKKSNEKVTITYQKMMNARFVAINGYANKFEPVDAAKDEVTLSLAVGTEQECKDARNALIEHTNDFIDHHKLRIEHVNVQASTKKHNIRINLASFKKSNIYQRIARMANDALMDKNGLKRFAYEILYAHLAVKYAIGTKDHQLVDISEADTITAIDAIVDQLTKGAAKQTVTAIEMNDEQSKHWSNVVWSDGYSRPDQVRDLFNEAFGEAKKIEKKFASFGYDRQLAFMRWRAEVCAVLITLIVSFSLPANKYSAMTNGFSGDSTGKVIGAVVSACFICDKKAMVAQLNTPTIVTTNFADVQKEIDDKKYQIMYDDTSGYHRTNVAGEYHKIDKIFLDTSEFDTPDITIDLYGTDAFRLFTNKYYDTVDGVPKWA